MAGVKRLKDEALLLLARATCAVCWRLLVWCAHHLTNPATVHVTPGTTQEGSR